jgi:hypothetical protein
MNSSLNLTGSKSAFLSARQMPGGSLTESLLGQGGASIVDSLTGSETMNVDMNHMVDLLVGPREDRRLDDEGVHNRRI